MATKYTTLVNLIEQFRQCGIKHKVQSNVMDTIKALEIVKNVRGNRAGRNYQRQIKPVVGYRQYFNHTQSHGISVNQSNLTCVQLNGSVSKPVINLNLGYLNARSINNKANQIAEYINDNKLDVCAISETWLGNSSKDVMWGCNA